MIRDSSRRPFYPLRPGDLHELNEVCRVLEAAELYDVIDMIADLLFRERRVLVRVVGDTTARLDPDLLIALHAVCDAVQGEPVPAQKRQAAIEALAKLHGVGGRAALSGPKERDDGHHDDHQPTRVTRRPRAEHGRGRARTHPRNPRP